MTYAGARGNTETQIAQVLHFAPGQERLHATFAALETRLNSIQKEGHIWLSVANSLWPQKRYPFLQEYLALIRERYGVVITVVDYTTEAETARKMINEWVETRTESKIAELIKPGVLNPLTRLVLVNAIYFKGNWASKFDAKVTDNAPFWVTATNSISVPTMNQTRKLLYAQADGIQILELPYAGNDLSMIVLLPKKVDGLAELQEAMTPERLEKWTSNLEETEVVVFLPRFKMTSEFRLDATLASMGMPDAFDDAKANFAGMDGRPDWLYIAAVLHKASVDVNEEGTEAAAATAVVIATKSFPQPPVVFRADHPFIFLIRDNVTHSILFFGRVVKPVVQ
jgi:serpin B